MNISPPNTPLETFSPIKVTVTPQKSSYFAGEPIRVLVSIRNTRSSPFSVQSANKPAHARGHKRSSHSVSSAQIYKPPTSPGPAQLTGTSGHHLVPRETPTKLRKGLIGSKLKARSLSVDIVALEGNEVALKQQDVSRDTYRVTTPDTQPRRSKGITSSHPHARKQSLDLGTTSTTSSQSNFPPHSPYASSLESISELGISPGLDRLSHRKGRETPLSDVPDDPGPKSGLLRRASLPPLGESETVGPTSTLRRVLSASAIPSGAEQLIYGFVRLRGLLTFDKTLNIGHLQQELRATKAFGGGSMDLLGFTPSSSPSRKSKPSDSSYFWSPFRPRLYQDTDNTAVSVFESQSVPLFVDLVIHPGDVRSFTYEITLPQSLPPTFKGRFSHIDYQLSIGISRARSSLDLPQTANYISQIMQIPLRIYDRVCRKGHIHAVVCKHNLYFSGSNVHDSILSKPIKQTLQSELPEVFLKREELRSYASRILDGNGQRHSDIIYDLEHSPVGDEMSPGSREAVEIVTRVARSVSFSIDKNSLHVANLIFAKTAYRLGEGISGILEMNQLDMGCIVTLKASIRLETSESLPDSLLDQTQQHGALRNVRLVSDFSSSNCRRTTRIAFALDIPSDATPQFKFCDSSRAGDPRGLEWQIRVSLLIGTPRFSESANSGQQRSLVRDSTPSEWDYTYTASSVFPPLARSHTLENLDPYREKGGWLSYFISSGLPVETGRLGSEMRQKTVPSKVGNQAWTESKGKERWKGKGREGFVEPDGLGKESEWQEIGLEMIECVVPIKVWPGNTAFRPNEIEFLL